MQDDAGEVLVDLVETIYANLDTREVLQAVTEAGTKLSGAEFGAFFSTRATADGENIFELDVLAGAPMSKFQHLAAQRITQLFEPTFHGRHTVRVGDITVDPRFAGLASPPLPLRSYLAVPVISRGGEALGALLFGHHDPNVFDERSEALVARSATHAAAAVENARVAEAEQAARHDAEQYERRLNILQEVTSKLAAARVPSDVADAVKDALRRPLGVDRIAIHLPSEDRFVALFGHGGPTEPFSPRLTALPYEWPSPIADAYHSRETVWVRSSAEFDAHYQQMAATSYGIDMMLTLPLVTRERVVGTLTMSWSSARPVPDADVHLVGAVADHVAAALERTRLYEAEARAQAQLQEYADQVTEASLTLQRALLPPTLPGHDAVTVAVRYLPAASGAEVGGDWYDVVTTPDGGVVYVIGDVEGHSMAAAAAMGQLRIAMLAYLSEGHPPQEAMARVNRLFMALSDELLATCCLMKVDPHTGAVEVIRAGHLSPLLVCADGHGVTEIVEDAGIPLGVVADATWEPDALHLRRGDRVLLYTDGLVERREADISIGIDELKGYALATRTLSVEDAADYVLERLESRQSDDIALLVFDYLGIAADGASEPPSSQTAVEDPHGSAADTASPQPTPLDAPPVGSAVPAPRSQRPTSAVALDDAWSGTLPGPQSDESASLTLTGERDVYLARRAARDWLDRCNLAHLEDTVTLLVSEMVTNALVHTTGPARMDLRLRPGGGVRLEVSDTSLVQPKPRDEGVEALGGRGMMLVKALAAQWGVEQTFVGKIVWADVTA